MRTYGELRGTSKRYDMTRKNDPAKRIRSSARWQKVRAMKLAESPLCERCVTSGVTTPAQQVHHVIPVRHAPHKAFDLDNLRSLCSLCHAIEERE